MESLGFVRPGQYLEYYGKGMLGVHLHDVSSCSDHLAPSYKGEVDFPGLKPFLGPDTLRIIEAHYPVTEEELINSKLFLQKVFDGKN
jgi:hypothetical protein